VGDRFADPASRHRLADPVSNQVGYSQVAGTQLPEGVVSGGCTGKGAVWAVEGFRHWQSRRLFIIIYLLFIFFNYRVLFASGHLGPLPPPCYIREAAQMVLHLQHQQSSSQF
jgi:hypothetical protein